MHVFWLDFCWSWTNKLSDYEKYKHDLQKFINYIYQLTKIDKNDNNNSNNNECDYKH